MIKYALLIHLILLVSACGPHEGSSSRPSRQLSEQEKDYIERFNVTAKDIRDFPPQGKNIENYFYIFKSVDKLEDAKILLFGETHTHAFNQVWSAGVINRLIKNGDVVLFEGDQAGTKVDNVTEHLTTGIFAAREYEKLKAHKTYKPTAISKIQNKYWNLFFSTKDFLVMNILNFNKGQGFFWDLKQGTSLHPDAKKRNETMVQTIKDNLKGSNRVFVIAGALHLPHHEFAHVIDYTNRFGGLVTFLAYPGAKVNELNDAFYSYFDGSAGKSNSDTKSVFDYLKGQDFAVLIPKNLPKAQALEIFYPKNAK